MFRLLPIMSKTNNAREHVTQTSIWELLCKMWWTFRYVKTQTNFANMNYIIDTVTDILTHVYVSRLSFYTAINYNVSYLIHHLF